jgi:hypothetical protein
MRKIAALAGGILLLVLVVAVSCGGVRSPGRTATPEEVAQKYFLAWGAGDFDAMRRLVADPPPDFTDRHRALSSALRVTSVEFVPGPVVRQGDQASVDYEVTRGLFGLGHWSFHAVLRLGRRHGRWQVWWSPATLHPALAEGGQLVITQLVAAPSAPVAGDGRPLPGDSSAQPYLAELSDRFGGDDGEPGQAVEVRNPGRSAQRLKVFGGGGAKPVRTTLDRRLQAAADRAVGSAQAALVAVRPSTGEVLAVADRLPGTTSAFHGLYPPGSTFKVITAADVLNGGMTPGTPVDCPSVTVAAQRTIHNDGDFALGTVPLGKAFADSCNTTFAKLGVSAGGPRLKDAAGAFGFGTHFDPGVQAYSGDFPASASGNALAEASIGQTGVQASPLAMAVVAAAVADGTCRFPRLVPERLLRLGRPNPLPAPVVAGLRSMMGEVTTQGTAAHAGLPAGTRGKTGTAEHPGGGKAHSWFIGYRGDLAFAAFVLDGGEGGQVAAPMAARFLAAVKS